jgi:hypothetical protein
MKSFNRHLLAAATASALGVGGAGAAQAAMMGVKAYSNLTIDNFQIFKSDGTQYSSADFDTLNVNNNSSTTGSTDVHGTAFSGVLDTTSGSGNANDNLSCVGACGGISDDQFGQQPAPTDNSFARGDTLLQGSLINGNSVTANAISEAQADNIEDTGEGNSSVGTGTEFSFDLQNDDTITFSFDGTPFLETMLESEFGSAFASLNFSINIVDNDTGNQVFTYEPGDLNESRSRLSQGTTIFNPGTSGFSATSPTLLADNLYTLSIDHRSRVTFASEVAAPATLGLLGLGLLALGWTTRRGITNTSTATHA